MVSKFRYAIFIAVACHLMTAYGQANDGDSVIVKKLELVFVSGKSNEEFGDRNFSPTMFSVGGFGNSGGGGATEHLATVTVKGKRKPPNADSNSNVGKGCDGGTASSDPALSNPVKLSTGEKLDFATDFESSGFGNFSLFRTYRSRFKSGTMFGANWLSNWDYPSLTGSGSVTSDGVVIPAQTLIYTAPDGSQSTYVWDGIQGDYDFYASRVSLSLSQGIAYNSLAGSIC